MDETTKGAILTLVANFSELIRQHCAQMEEVKRERDALRDHVETLLAQVGNDSRAVAAETALMNILKHAPRNADELMVGWAVKAKGEWVGEDALADFRAGWAVIDKLAGPRPHHPRDY